MPPADAPSGAGALEIFADWLSQRAQEPLVDFATLVRRHPSLEPELRELHATWERLSAASEPESSSLQQRLASRFGAESLSQVSLREREEGGTGADLSAELIRELSAHDKNFGRYQIRGEVARGGMGAILKIWDEELRRHLAMKVILGQADVPRGGATPPMDSSKVARFLEEAQVTSQLDHPGIVPVHELGMDPQGRLYFTMKLVKGESLHEIFEHARTGRDDWTQARALNVLLKVCEAMAYAHDKGVIHRDLKPANVMVGKFGEVHVMDWGLARIEGQKDRKDIRIRAEEPRSSEMRGVRSEERAGTPDSPLYTLDGDVVGTPAYMPPEQAAGKLDEVGAHSDVYALGAMLYHLIAGHPPYLPRGTRLNNHAVWARVQAGPPIPLAQLAPRTPLELLAICDKAMSREWKDRYRDMSELAADLSAYLNQRVVRAYETGTWAETRKWVRRNQPLAASLAAALLLLAAGLTASLIFKAKADEKALLAEAEKASVIKLWAFETIDDLTREADEELWPARPALVPRLRDWMQRAELLVARLPAFRADLAELEQRALPQTEEERARERASHPRAQELVIGRAQLHWMRRLLGEEPALSLDEAELALSKETLPADAQGLIVLAAPLVDASAVHGSEARGVLLLRRALVVAGPDELSKVHMLLGWAELRLGHWEAALAEGEAALNAAGAAPDPLLKNVVGVQKLTVESWLAPSGSADDAQEKLLEARTREREALEKAVVALESEIARRREWRFGADTSKAAADDLGWHTQLAKLVAALESLADERTGLMRGTSGTHGWGVVRRLEFASTIEERTVSGETARQLWSDASAAIEASPKYGGLKLQPQLGLLPIGADPDSGLWEFAHVQSGEPAVRGEDGKLRVTERTGLVLVLIPGGTFWMGSQKTDPNARNYDEQGIEDAESPVREVRLSPYFLSKYEMTQGQWQNSTGRNPSQLGPGRQYMGLSLDLTHPVEFVSWTECGELLARLALELPSDAQWENGCRGGTDTPWWTGAIRETLRGNVNLADQTAAAAGATWTDIADWPDLVDGWVAHAVVGSLPANPFGLHEVHANVWEWCVDGTGGYPAGVQTDPVGGSLGSGFRIYRGGAFNLRASTSRSANRPSCQPSTRDATIGVRPARKLEG